MKSNIGIRLKLYLPIILYNIKFITRVSCGRYSSIIDHTPSPFIFPIHGVEHRPSATVYIHRQIVEHLTGGRGRSVISTASCPQHSTDPHVTCVLCIPSWSNLSMYLPTITHSMFITSCLNLGECCNAMEICEPFLTLSRKQANW